MISALVQGDLIADPVARTTASGKGFATATVRVGAGVESILLGIAVFSSGAVERLLQLRKGDAVAATGTLEANVWVDKDGNERKGWRLTANSILTVYEAGKRRKVAQAEDEAR